MGWRAGCVEYPEMAIMLSAKSIRDGLFATAASMHPKKLII